jgi:hypothetical protein
LDFAASTPVSSLFPPWLITAFRAFTAAEDFGAFAEEAGKPPMTGLLLFGGAKVADVVVKLVYRCSDPHVSILSLQGAD